MVESVEAQCGCQASAEVCCDQTRWARTLSAK